MLGVNSFDLLHRNINEDKRKAEGHQVMFEIVNDVENCPVCRCVCDSYFSTFIVFIISVVILAQN